MSRCQILSMSGRAIRYQCRNCKIWPGNINIHNINITATVLTGLRQQYNNSDRKPTSAMAGMRTVQKMKQSLDNTVDMISHIFSGFNKFLLSKRIKVNVKSKRITVCVTMISTSFMKINNQTITAYRIYMIFWLIFWLYFVAFLGDSISINHPKCKTISIQWARCQSQLYTYYKQGTLHFLDNKWLYIYTFFFYKT